MEYTKRLESLRRKERTDGVVAAADKGKEIDVDVLLRAPVAPGTRRSRTRSDTDFEFDCAFRAMEDSTEIMITPISSCLIIYETDVMLSIHIQMPKYLGSSSPRGPSPHQLVPDRKLAIPDGVDRPCEEPLLAVLCRLYWNMSCSRDNFSCCASGKSDILDRGGDRGEGTSARLLTDTGEVGTITWPFESRTEGNNQMFVFVHRLGSSLLTARHALGPFSPSAVPMILEP